MHTYKTDAPISQESHAVISGLTQMQLEAIDLALFSQISGEWRKIARVVGGAMLSDIDRVRGIPDLYYAERLRAMIKLNKLQAQGDLTSMRHGEVRRFSEEK
jgi:hypothetical protein